MWALEKSHKCEKDEHFTDCASSQNWTPDVLYHNDEHL